MDEESVVYIHNRILFNHKSIILPFPTSTELEGIMLSELSQRKTPYGFTYVWNLNNK